MGESLLSPTPACRIVRTLSVSWARPLAGRVLVEEFRRTDDRTDMGLRWVIANALEVVADVELHRFAQPAQVRRVSGVALEQTGPAQGVCVAGDRAPPHLQHARYRAAGQTLTVKSDEIL